MLTLYKSQLRAALTHAAVNNVRYYLNGVMLERPATGNCLHLVATDGHRMFCGLIDAPIWDGTPQQGPWQIIIPADVIKTAAKSSRGDNDHIMLTAMGDGRYMLGNTTFTPIDGRFPDWRRVMPDSTQEHGESQFNWRYIADAQTALQTWYGAKPTVTYWLKTFAEGKAGLMLGSDCTAFCVIMPVSDKTITCATPFTPCTYEKAKDSATMDG